MATAVENLNKHLHLAVLKIISGTVNEIPDSTFELVDEIYGFATVPYRAGIPRQMKGPEIVAALKGIVNTTTSNTLDAHDRAKNVRFEMDTCSPPWGIAVNTICVHHNLHFLVFVA